MRGSVSGPNSCGDLCYPRATRTAVLLFSSVLVAGDHVVDYDRTVDFSGIRTFAFRNSRVGMDRPEIRNSLVTDRATGAIRSALLARGLREVEQGADILVSEDARRLLSRFPPRKR